MFWAAIPVILSSLLAGVKGQQSPISCKNPAMAQRLLADDVRFASPFYVIALPRTPETEKIDNICYTYFETGSEVFDHIISVTYNDRSNKYHRFTKGDIKGRMGLAEAKAVGSSCTYHDHTLIPICNSTVFVLYRCFKEGSCNYVDFGEKPGVDARIALAATPRVSQECYRELEMSLRDTSFWSGDEYIILPQSQKPQCVTKYNNTFSIGAQRSAGNKEVVEDETNDRFGGNEDKVDVKQPQTGQKPPKPDQPAWTNQKTPPQKGYHPSGTSFHTSMSGPGHSSSFSFSQASSAVKPGGPTWHQSNQWSQGPNPWGHHSHPDETHYHSWQRQPGGAVPLSKPTANNVYYHVHNWENPPPGCCKCN